jgi:hypothetical protein
MLVLCASFQNTSAQLCWWKNWLPQHHTANRCNAFQCGPYVGHISGSVPLVVPCPEKKGKLCVCLLPRASAAWEQQQSSASPPLWKPPSGMLLLPACLYLLRAATLGRDPTPLWIPGACHAGQQLHALTAGLCSIHYARLLCMQIEQHTSTMPTHLIALSVIPAGRHTTRASSWHRGCTWCSCAAAATHLPVLLPHMLPPQFQHSMADSKVYC